MLVLCDEQRTKGRLKVKNLGGVAGWATRMLPFSLVGSD